MNAADMALRPSLLALAAALMLGAAAAAPRGEGDPPADLILTDAKVVTVDAADTRAEAVAVRDGRIVAVGSAAEIATWQGPDTEVVDLDGRTVLPGFIDSHSHIASMANVELNYINIQVPPLKDGQAVIAKLKAAQAGRPKGAWLRGQGTYNQVMPSRAELDAAFPDTPVALEWSVHDILLNHAAAVALGMGKDFPDPPKGSTGRYERTADGEVIIVRDAPANLPKLPFSYAQMKEGVRTILEDFYLEKGVTTVSDLSEPSAFRAEQELRAEGRLPVRIIMNYWARPRTAALDGIGTSGSLDDIVQTGLFTGAGDDWMRLGAIKILLDGAWGTTAAISRPVWEGSSTTWVPDNYGGVTFDQEALDATVLKAHTAGWQIETHANGDRAQDMILTSYEKAQQAAPRADARARIEHFGNFLVDTTPAQTAAHLARMVRDKVIPSTQTAFLWRLTDVNIHEPGVRFFANRTMIDAGMRPAGGVDTVGTQNFATSPLFSIARAVGRRTKYGSVAHASEAITVLEAIKMFTVWAAEASFIEDTRGSIEAGKLADFAVLDGDPFTTPPDSLPDIPVAMTIIDGRIAYRRQ